MKVVVATNNTYPPQRVGGSESSMHGICLELRKRDIEVVVLAKWSLLQPSAWSYLRNSLGRQNRRLVRDSPYGYPVYRSLNPAAAVAELVEDVRPDVAVVNPRAQMRLAQQFTSLGVPTIVYIRDAFFDELGGPVRRSSAIRYVTTSQALANRFEKVFGIRPVCIPPIVAPELYRVEPARRNVTFVCPKPKKGLDTALRIAGRRPDIPFVFVESWPINIIRRIPRDLWIRRHANVVLRDRTHDMRIVYREAKVVLVPSACREGWGRVASEAQVSGIPVLASNVCGLPEAVGPGGILVDPDADIESWVAALARLWDDPTEYDKLSRLALDHARRAEFVPETLAGRLVAEITELLAAT